MTENFSSPADPSDLVLETGQRLSQSLLWKLQRQFFEQQGIQAWTADKVVPHYVTSNPFIANAFGKVAFGFLRDCFSVGHSLTARRRSNDASLMSLDVSQPIYILELGAGSGRFAYHFIQQFFAHYPHSTLRDLPVKYVMTDFAPQTLQFWQSHPSLQPWVKQGRLDFAHFDGETPAPLRLIRSGDLLTPNTLTNPLIVLANYFIDSIPQDLFTIHDGQLHETLLTLAAPELTRGLPPAELLKSLQITYDDRPISSSYYDNPNFNQILTEYQQNLTDTTFLFPTTALNCLGYLRQLAGDRLLLLSADKGQSQEKALCGRGRPHFAFHGSFSISVNYHAIVQYVQNQDGQALVPKHRTRSLQVCAFLFGPSDYLETRHAYYTAIEETGPDDFFSVKKTIEPHYGDLSLQNILAYLRFSGWDHNIFLGCWPTLMTQMEMASEDLRQETCQAIQQIWKRYYWMGEEKDLPFHLSQLLIRLEKFADAIPFLDYSLQLYGERALQLMHLAICHLNLGQRRRGLSILDRALESDPALKDAKMLRQAIVTDKSVASPDVSHNLVQNINIPPSQNQRFKTTMGKNKKRRNTIDNSDIATALSNRSRRAKNLPRLHDSSSSNLD